MLTTGAISVSSHVRVKPETHLRLWELKVQVLKKRGKNLSFDDLINLLLDEYSHKVRWG